MPHGQTIDELLKDAEAHVARCSAREHPHGGYRDFYFLMTGYLDGLKAAAECIEARDGA